MFLDLQFQTSKFLDLLQDQIQRSLPLITDEFDSPLGGAPLLIEHLDVASVTADTAPPATTVTISGPEESTDIDTEAVRFVVRVGAFLTTRENVIAAGHLGVPEVVFRFDFDVDVDLSAHVGAGGALVLDAVPSALRPVLDLLDDATIADLLRRLPSLRRPISLPDIAGRRLEATNAGLVSAAGTVALRVELGEPTAASVSAWRSWFGGSLPSTTSGEWAIFIPRELLVEIVDAAITNAVTALAEGDPDVEVSDLPTTSWSAAGAESVAAINAIDACPAFDLDIEADLLFSVRFALADGRIQLTIRLEWDLVDSDVLACGTALVLLLGGGIAGLAGLIGGPIAAAVAGGLAIVGWIISFVVISDEAHASLSRGTRATAPGGFGLEVVENDDEHAVFRGHVPLSLPLPGMGIASITTTTQGLEIAGTLAVPGHFERTLAGSVRRAFGWDARYSCSSRTFVIDPLEAQLGLGDPNRQPLEAAVTVLNRPADFTVRRNMWSFPSAAGGSVRTGVTVEVHSHLEPGLAIACELLVHTTSGIRYANLGWLPARPRAPGASELVRLRAACFKSKLPGPKRWLEANWRIREPRDRRSARMWEVVVSGAGANRPVELATVGEQGDPSLVAGVRSSKSGVARFRLVTAPDRHVAVAVGPNSKNVQIIVAGSLLEETARFAPSGALLAAVVVEPRAAQALIAVAVAHSVLLFDVDAKLRQDLQMPHVRGLAALGPLLYALDIDGIGLIDTGLPGVKPAMRRWTSKTELASLRVEGHLLRVDPLDGKALYLDRDLHETRQTAKRSANTWTAAPWMSGSVREDRLFLAATASEAIVYRCMRRRLF